MNLFKKIKEWYRKKRNKPIAYMIIMTYVVDNEVEHKVYKTTYIMEPRSMKMLQTVWRYGGTRCVITLYNKTITTFNIQQIDEITSVPIYDESELKALWDSPRDKNNRMLGYS